MAAEDSTEICDHDWRVNPNVTLTSDPPQKELRCARCGARRYVVSEVRGIVDRYRVETWPKWSGSVPLS